MVVSGVALVATQAILKEGGDFTTLVANDESNSSSSSTSNFGSGSGKGGCSIYLVKKSERQYLGGDSKMGSVSEIIGKVKDPKAFLERKKANHNEFVKKVEEKGCKNGSGRGGYVYESEGVGTYLDDLQRLDGARKLRIKESSISEVEH